MTMVPIPQLGKSRALRLLAAVCFGAAGTLAVRGVYGAGFIVAAAGLEFTVLASLLRNRAIRRAHAELRRLQDAELDRRRKP